MVKPRQRILYYFQSLVGIGHLTASLLIIKALSEHFDIDLIYGGIPYRNFPVLPDFRVLQLPALMFNSDGELYAPEQECSIDEIWQCRQQQISEFAQGFYCAVLFEFYPFGRRKFKKEIRSLIQQIRKVNSDVLLFRKIREVLIRLIWPAYKKC